MGSNITPSHIRGFIQPLKITKDHVWTAQSTYNEQNPIAGMPQPNGNYNLVLTSTGDQNDIQNIQITTKRSGSIGKESGATFTFKEDGTTDEHGYEHATLSGYEVIQGESTTVKYSKPQSTANSNGDLFVVFVAFSTITLKYSVMFGYRSQGEGTWAISTVLSGLEINPQPAICMLNDDDILIVYYTKPDTDKANLSSLLSSDLGTTWNILSDNALFDDIDTSATVNGYTLGRLSMSATVDNVLIIAALTSNNAAVTHNLMGQFASNNRGGSFVLVGITDTSGVSFDRSSASITAFQGDFYVSYIKNNDFVSFYKLPNPYYDMTNLDVNLDEITIIADIPIGSGTPTIGENVLFCDVDGTFYNINQNIGGSKTFTNSVFMSTSRQDGQNWQAFNNKGPSSSTGLDPDPIFNMSSSSIILEEMSATMTQGRIALVSSFSGSASLNDSIVVHYMGGYTTRTQGPMRNFAKYTDLAGYIVTWTPLELPDTGPEFTVSGGGTATLTIDGLNITNSKVYTATRTTTTPSQGYSIRCSLKQNTPSAYSEIIKLNTSDGVSESYSVSIKVNAGGVQIFDNIASSTVGSASINTSTGIELLISLRGDKLYLWYQRFKGASNDVINDYKTWALLESSNLQDDNNTTITASTLSWGNYSTVGHDVDFYEFAFSLGTYTGINFTPTTELNGRMYPFTGLYSYLNGGCLISTKDGPAFTGQTYNIQQSSEFPIERSFVTVSKSPRVAWRSRPYSGSSGGAMRIPFFVDKDIQENEDSELGTDLLGLFLGNINFNKFKIQYYNIGSAAWVDLATIETYTGMTFNYTRHGSTVIYASNIDDFYLYHGEAIGWTILLEDGLGDFHAVEIEHNTAGSFVGSSYDRAKRPVIRLKNPSTSLPTSGEARLVPSNVAVTISLLGIRSPAWAIEIQDSNTFTGDYRIGSIAFGPVIIQAPQYARGRTMTLEPRVNVLETEDSNIYTQKISDARRILRISWSTGVSLHNYYSGDLEPDYYVSSTQAGALPVASYEDVPYQLEGFYRYIDGPNLPIVYLPSIKLDTGSDRIQIHNRRESFIYGVTMGDLSLESMLGDEMQDEVLRVSTITIQEVI
jgi:hypothetical protein